MRAVVLHEYGGPEKLKFEDNVPQPPISGGTVLIAAAAATVNPIDWKMRSGMRQKDFPLSFGLVKIVNRKKLEDSACECYPVIQQYDG